MARSIYLRKERWFPPTNEFAGFHHNRDHESDGPILDTAFTSERKANLLSRWTIDNDPGGTSPVEMVEHPKYYNQHQTEPIDVINDWELPFDLGCVVKYISRYKYKGATIEDLEKASFYLNDFIERLKNGSMVCSSNDK